ncbi:hypothetical protein GGD81_001121 [Rhodobium orientis]|uniref:site-specific DNA-methyltransferase (adenine-specific) n=1 Tax=Rhodobium orientis TaxID=34017 RepID=A0A327JM25_9HYPH|nr:DNA methyltransferase [Rhodobium orientis]MBB4302097.1 hypothetical protein [Rhodobium orientis]MBK5951313.1 hypothetical protein [Rhodobium orientis]RAI25892.1 hypothetical protein CH339_16280 [Rhodobium orientis]
MGDSAARAQPKLETFVAEAKASGGSELANYQLFVVGLAEALGLERPQMAGEENQFNDYVFERRVDFKHPDGSRTAGRIDCYKRDCFVLEAKQSAKRTKKATGDQLALLPEDAGQKKPGHAKRGTRGWDKVMVAARKQAEDYARALPVEHGYPPFLLVVDVGNVIEVFADFSGQGKNYAHFPDRRSYRISMDDLFDEKVQDQLAAIWNDPLSLDPAKESAEVTREVATRLAKIARRLEKKHDPKDVAEFLMRCLFTMFAEDVELLADDGFEKLMGRMKETPQHFVPALESLWAVMDEGGYAPHLNATVRRFNGALFKSRKALPLEAEDIADLHAAAGRNWKHVEPAIFGTLLERALDSRERSKLGAHYTPRAYVERLVIPTLIEPLRKDWDEIQVRVRDLHEAGRDDEALRVVKQFHHTLCTTRVLDPACGTGNFLYVALELMKKLEGEVLEALDDLGEDQARFTMEGETVGPRQFFGLELNPRAVPIADLVLWIGYLKWQLKTGGPGAITEPILHAYGTIREQDAILAYDARELVRGEDGTPLARWDGVTKKPHPITGEEVPDPAATVPVYAYVNPRPAPWPEAEFIVGNPPFIGGKDMRAELGDGYAEACWKARPQMPGGADFVMHFWDEAATRLTRKGTKKSPNPLRRFGFITTNSITQTFSRRVIERHMAAKTPLSLVFAIPNHPWLKASDKAAVRIAMTVAEAGESEGVLAEVVSEEGLNSDTPKVGLETREGKIQANIAVGPDLSSLVRLKSNEHLSFMGFKLHGQGFVISKNEADRLRIKTPRWVKKYLIGRDIARKSRELFTIDTYPEDISEIEIKNPGIYQLLLEKVKPERENNNDGFRRNKWWWYGRPHDAQRDSIRELEKYIVTVRQSSHRYFLFVDVDTVVESTVVMLGLQASWCVSVLSSSLHTVFSLATGGWLGVGNDPRYQHESTFNPFPFPACVTDDSDPALKKRLGDLGERLDAFRKERLAEHEFLTMTGLYNVLERVRELEAGCDVPPLSDKERDIYEAGLVGVLKELHDDIDRAAFAAYGWDDLAEKLVGKPGATTPSPHKTADQEAAEEELLTRLVALNRERAAEEARGLVRWLRPDYQIPKLGHKVARPEEGEQIAADMTPILLPEKPKWPADGLDQIRLLRDVLAKAQAPARPADISAQFKGGRNRLSRVEQVLEHMLDTGMVRTGDLDGDTAYFLPR